MNGESLLEFLDTDEMMINFKKSIEEDGISREEIATILRFLCSFAINSKRAGMNELSDVFGKRVNAFVYYVKSRGYKSGKMTKGNKTFGIETLISQACYNLGYEK
jgi:hypothetical protein